MKTASPALLALLASGQFCYAELFTLTLASGTVLRWTSADTALAYGGHTFSPWPLKRGSVRTVLGVQVDSLALTLYGTVDDVVAGQPLPQLAERGGFDAARVLVERLIMPTWGDTSAGTVHVFQGRVASCEPSRTQVALTVNSDLELLNIKLPRNLYQAGCRHTLFDAGCALSKAAHAVTGQVTANGTAINIYTDLTGGNDYYALGTVEFLSGANAGEIRTVRSNTAGMLVLLGPLPQAPQAGDAVAAWPGCDKTQQTCQNRFGNKANFGGFPFIPQAEQAT
jgi:uncharacterized phage protein (TIGR02218 family)